MNDEKRSEMAIINNDPIKTKFNGKTYLWYEKPRREQRAVRDGLVKVTAKISELNDGFSVERLDLVT